MPEGISSFYGAFLCVGHIFPWAAFMTVTTGLGRTVKMPIYTLEAKNGGEPCQPKNLLHYSELPKIHVTPADKLLPNTNARFDLGMLT